MKNPKVISWVLASIIALNSASASAVTVKSSSVFSNLSNSIFINNALTKGLNLSSIDNLNHIDNLSWIGNLGGVGTRYNDMLQFKDAYTRKLMKMREPALIRLIKHLNYVIWTCKRSSEALKIATKAAKVAKVMALKAEAAAAEAEKAVEEGKTDVAEKAVNKATVAANKATQAANVATQAIRKVNTAMRAEARRVANEAQKSAATAKAAAERAKSAVENGGEKKKDYKITSELIEAYDNALSFEAVAQATKAINDNELIVKINEAIAAGTEGKAVRDVYSSEINKNCAYGSRGELPVFELPKETTELDNVQLLSYLIEVYTYANLFLQDVTKQKLFIDNGFLSNFYYLITDIDTSLSLVESAVTALGEGAKTDEIKELVKNVEEKGKLVETEELSGKKFASVDDNLLAYLRAVVNAIKATVDALLADPELKAIANAIALAAAEQSAETAAQQVNDAGGDIEKQKAAAEALKKAAIEASITVNYISDQDISKAVENATKFSPETDVMKTIREAYRVANEVLEDKGIEWSTVQSVAEELVTAVQQATHSETVRQSTVEKYVAFLFATFYYSACGDSGNSDIKDYVNEKAKEYTKNLTDLYKEELQNAKTREDFVYLAIIPCEIGSNIIEGITSVYAEVLKGTGYTDEAKIVEAIPNANITDDDILKKVYSAANSAAYYALCKKALECDSVDKSVTDAVGDVVTKCISYINAVISEGDTEQCKSNMDNAIETARELESVATFTIDVYPLLGEDNAAILKYRKEIGVPTYEFFDQQLIDLYDDAVTAITNNETSENAIQLYLLTRISYLMFNVTIPSFMSIGFDVDEELEELLENSNFINNLMLNVISSALYLIDGNQLYTQGTLTTAAEVLQPYIHMLPTRITEIPHGSDE